MYKTLQLLLVMGYRTLLLAVVLIGGTLVYAEVEDVSYHMSAHFCWTIVTTIGYGGTVPKEKGGKIFTMAYGFIGIPTVLFCMASYAIVLNHSLKKLIAALETCCSSRKQISNIHLKHFIALLILLIGEWLGCAYVIHLQNDWSYFDAMYAWFCTITTIGFGDFIPTFPPTKKSLANQTFCYLVTLFTLVTLTAVIESILGMIESINKKERGFCAKLLCCYNNDDKDSYDIQKDSMTSSNYVKE